MGDEKQYRVEGAILSIGQVEKRSGVAASALRFYEKKGLISSTRNAGGQRRYFREVLRRVSVIKTAQRLGIPLEEIAREFSALPQGRAPTAQEWQRLSSHWRMQLNQRIERLTLLRDQLDDCIGCGCLSLKTCPLRNPNDEAAEEGPGALMFEQVALVESNKT